MSNEDDDRLVVLSLRVSAVAAVCCLLGGLLVLAAWWLAIPQILAPGPSRERVSPDAALAFIAVGLGLWSERSPDKHTLRRRRALGVCLLVLALINLMAEIGGLNLGISPLLFRSVGANTMAINTAVAFLFLGASLLLLDRPSRPEVSPSQVVSLIGGLIGAFATLGYLYGVDVLIGLPQATMVALPTAVLLVVAAVGIQAVRPQVGWMATLLSPRVGGQLLRRLLAPVMLLPPLVGYLALGGQLAGAFDSAFGYAIIACVDVFLITWLLLLTARQIDQAEAGRLSEQSLRRKLEELGEATVAISGAIIASQQVGLSSTLEIRSDMNMMSILQAIVDQACKITGAAIGALGIVSEPEAPFCPWVFAGMDPDLVGQIGRYPRPVGTLGAVARDGVTIRTPDVTAHEAFRGLPPGHPPVTSLLAVPIRFEGTSVGNLYLGNKQGALEFSADDQQAMEMLVPHAAVALRQAQMRAVIGSQRAHIESVLAAAPNGIVFVDAQSGVPAANAMANTMLGMALDPGQGRSQYLGLFRHPDGRPAILDELPSSRALAGESVLAEEWLIVRPDGHRMPVLVSASPIQAEAATIDGAVVILQDITKRKSLEQAREEYLALFSHDLRGPLTVIALQAETLRQSTDTSVLSRAESIKANVDRLTAMLTDLVESSRMEAGQTSLHLLPRDLTVLIPHMLATALSDEDRARVTLQLPPRLPAVALDQTRFERVLTNLIGNVGKYGGPDWRVTVSAREAQGGVEVSVADSGPGIPPADLPHLFEKYFRGQRGRKAAGLGLGLYICRLIVSAHGGRIWAENRPEGGAVVRIQLPAASAAAQQAA
jgi:PAS domain S-box-containing protein